MPMVRRRPKRRHVASWHNAVVALKRANVRCWRVTGPALLVILRSMRGGTLKKKTSTRYGTF